MGIEGYVMTSIDETTSQKIDYPLDPAIETWRNGEEWVDGDGNP